MYFNATGVKLINARYHQVSLMKKNIDNGQTIKTIPFEEIDFKLTNVKKYIMLIKLNPVNKERTFCFNVPFGILKLNSCVDIEKMCLLFYDIKINEYKILCINVLSLSYSFKKL